MKEVIYPRLTVIHYELFFYKHILRERFLCLYSLKRYEGGG